MKRIIGILTAVLMFASCEDLPEGDVANNASDIEVDLNGEPLADKIEVGSISHIETLFDQVDFENALDYDLLKELDVCDTVELEASKCATCSPKYYKLHEYNNKKQRGDAFMLQIKALTVMKGQEVPLPMRHLIVFERENGSLVKVNGFRGNLIATRESESGVKDLIVRFYIPDEGAFMNCLFLWKDGRYKFESVEAIDGAGGKGSVKESVKAEISKEVYQTLMANAMLF
ncbi:MAG: hypothetical protein MK105_08535 [Crocinitomicaceae bacterium]|nr:hypothetical protein [Crocinitomicaceae bacterium]